MYIDAAEKVATYCKQVLNLPGSDFDEFYQSLPLCVVDSVYSIGVNYESTKQVVIRYCDYFGLQRVRVNRYAIPIKEEQQSVEDFLQKFFTLGLDGFTQKVFNNRQRTSTRGGILKAEAVVSFASILRMYNINYLQDVRNIISNNKFEEDIKGIPGQGSGLSLRYFFMLCGFDDYVKPDRMILRFLGEILQKTVTIEEAQAILLNVSNMLKNDHPEITPRSLDHEIWKYQRQKE